MSEDKPTRIYRTQPGKDSGRRKYVVEEDGKVIASGKTDDFQCEVKILQAARQAIMECTIWLTQEDFYIWYLKQNLPKISKTRVKYVYELLLKAVKDVVYANKNSTPRGTGLGKNNIS